MNTTDSIKSLIDKSKEYLETKIELTRLKTIDRSADILSSVIVMVSIIFLGSLFIIFISIALALIIGHWLGAAQYGFLIIGGFYALLLLVIYLQRDKWIKTPIANGLIHKMLK
jgi:hypothetical protein